MTQLAAHEEGKLAALEAEGRRGHTTRFTAEKEEIMYIIDGVLDCINQKRYGIKWRCRELNTKPGDYETSCQIERYLDRIERWLLLVFRVIQN